MEKRQAAKNRLLFLFSCLILAGEQENREAAMLYQISDGTVSVGGNVILRHIDFEIKGAEKIALVGRNGAGENHPAAPDCRGIVPGPGRQAPGAPAFCRTGG